MTQKLKQVAEREIAKLPDEFQKAISSVDWVGISEEIGKKHALTDIEIHDLQSQTLLVIIGLSDSDIFTEKLILEAKFESQKAEEVAKDVNSKIFHPILEKIEQLAKNNAFLIKNAKPEQNINFILSGGNYAAFLSKAEQNSDEQRTDELIGKSNILETKKKFDL